MPIALHPDALIAVILPAAVYPLEIVQAARFVKDTNNIPKVDDQPWDENVKALAKFPDMIARMDADLQWTVQLGQAFLDQPKEVMDTIQELRAKAQKAGTLRTTPQQIVTVTNVVVLETNYTQIVNVTNQVVQVAPANPQVVYVPTYPPTVYYPPPTYVYNPVAPLVTFGVGMAWGAILANNCDWHHGGVYNDVDIDVDRDVNRERNVNRETTRNQNRSANRTTQQGNRPANSGTRQQKWQPDQSRMRASGAPSAASREARGWGGSSTQGNRPTASTGMSGRTPSSGNVGARPSTGNAGTRPSTANTAARPSGGGQAANRASSPSASRPSSSTRQASSSSFNRPSGGSSSAFSGMNSGASSRSYSSRGSASRGGGFSGGGGRGGGRGGGGRR
jgi:hypothetical protein